MPAYEFTCVGARAEACPTSDRPITFYLRIDQMNEPQICEACAGPMERLEISQVQPGKVDYRYRPSLTTEAGQKIYGTFEGGPTKNKGRCF